MSRICTLIYHRVVSPTSTRPRDFFQIEVQIPTFEAQIEHLVARYGILEPELAIEGLLSGSSASSQILLTFDDGYRNTLLRVAPILRRLGVRAIAFICPDHIDHSGSHFWWDIVAQAAETGSTDRESQNSSLAVANALRDGVKRLEYSKAHARVLAAVGSDLTMSDEHAVASWSDLRSVSDVFLFAIHGYSHDYLSALSPERLNADLDIGDELCARNGCQLLPIIAYPFGDSACVTASQIRFCINWRARR